MPVRIEPHAEPIPGYKLIERLGGGGFGEVWKAEAPGGLFKAIKFVYGDLQAVGDDDGSRAEQELKAMSRVKSVHHPYILSLERFDIIDGQLMIVMELADQTLWDRLKDCRNLGLPGIPRDELLKYMRETAEALDLMNTQFQLQHLDIKPQNLFLVFNHVKVADFGLVKDLGTKAAATITGGVTPVYAAPETFDGWLSRFSDQYSLAIVFQELLTGVRPFTGATMRQLVLQHIQGNPDLSPLPPADRSVVARALSKNPDDRYPSCLEFVQMLNGQAPTAALASGPVGSAENTPSISELGIDPLVLSDEVTHGARGKSAGPPRSSNPDFCIDDPQDPGRPNVLPPRPDWATPKPPARGPRPEVSVSHTEPISKRPKSAASIELPGADSNGDVQPALVIGLGKLGLETLRQFRQRLRAEFSAPDDLPHLRFLGIDTDPQTIHDVQFADPAGGMRAQELLLTRLHRPSHYIKGKGSADDWLNQKLIYRIPREQNGAGLRPLGRLALVDNFRSLYKRLETELQACVDPEALAEASRIPEMGPRTHVPRIYIVTSLTGNTGSGMFLDIAYVVRHLLRKQGLAAAVEVVGLLLLPAAGTLERSNPAALANSCAALMELNHFSSPRTEFKARYETGEKARLDLVENGAPFQRCVLLNLPQPQGPFAEPDNRPVLALAGDFLYRDLATAFGRQLDERRQELVGMRLSTGAMRNAEPLCQSFGLFRITWPRQALLARCSKRLSRRLVDRWMSKDPRPIAPQVTTWAQEKWEKLQLRPENLIGRFHETSERILQQTTERFFANVPVPLYAGQLPEKCAQEALRVGAYIQIMQQLEKYLGIPEECRPQHQAPGDPGKIEAALDQRVAGLSDEMEQKIAELAVALIEDPSYRLAGAEEGLRQFNSSVEQALQSQEVLAKELHERANLFYRKALTYTEDAAPTVAPSATLWKGPFARRSAPNGPGPTAEAADAVRNYAKARYHSLILAHMNRFYVGLRGQLSDQLREVGFCRQRLSELGALVAPTGPDAPQNWSASDVRMLLPYSCHKLDEAVERVEDALTPTDLLAFDRQVQILIRQHYRALVQVCMGSSTSVKNLSGQLLREAERFLQPRLRELSVAEMYFAQKASADANPEGGDAGDAIELQRFFEKAAPRTGVLEAERAFSVLAVPNDAQGRELQRLLRERVPDAHILPTPRTDEVVFYREQLLSNLAELEQMSPAVQELYQQRATQDPSTLHIRDDMPEFQPQGTPTRG